MSNRLTALAAVFVALVVLAYSSAFTINPTNQALVLQFGQVKRSITESGLYFKIPLIQNVEYIDKRILDLDLESQEVRASDQKQLIVDAFSRYRIADPVRFFQSVRTVEAANQRLSTFLQSSLRAVIADAPFFAVVRDSRAQMMDQIKRLVDTQARLLGIEVVDVRIRRADLPAQNSQAVFQRMQTERQREASELRARGSEESQRIRAKAAAEREVILAEANRDSERARGEGEAQRNGIFASVVGRDPEFYAFYRSLQAYEASMKATDTRMVLSPKSDFFRFFNAPTTIGLPHVPETPATPPAEPATPTPTPDAGAAATPAPAP
jgi:membrane protease subunit HflC